VYITVVGAGAVGGYFGGRLAQAGFDVTFLVREQRAKRLTETGLVIKSPFGDAELVPNIAIDPARIAACDLIILSVKNYHMEATIESLRPLVDKGAYILPLLNGVEHFQMLEQAFGKERIIGGLTHIISTLDANGQILHTNRTHSITYGPLHDSQIAICKKFKELSAEANCVIKLSSDIQTEIWNKYSFITAFSGVTTASRLPIDEVLACPATANVFFQALKEMSELAAAYDAKLPDQYVEKTIESIKRLPQGSTSSMHQDFRKGLPLEVESLQGAAVRLAQRKGRTVPTVETLYGLIKPFEIQKGTESYPI
jgi:2-dehydropantoate 2-reductase